MRKLGNLGLAVILTIIIGGCAIFFQGDPGPVRIHVKGDEPFNPVFEFDKEVILDAFTVSTCENGNWKHADTWAFRSYTKTAGKYSKIAYGKTPAGFTEMTPPKELSLGAIYLVDCMAPGPERGFKIFKIVTINGQSVIVESDVYTLNECSLQKQSDKPN